MRQLKGVPLNSTERIIGKIVIGEVSGRKKKNRILVTSTLDKRYNRFRAILTPTKIKEGARPLKIPIVHSIEGIETLGDGDVVSLDMSSGHIFVEYEKRSLHNSILATNKCNCRCIMCPQPSLEYSPDVTKFNLEIIKLMDKTTEAIGITGGEPTLLGNGLIKILEQCNKYLPNTQIQILTNGILLKDKDYVRRIARLGMRNIIFCIPLYADTDVEHDFIMQRKGAFEDTVQGLYTLAAYNQSVEIRSVILSLNYRRLPQIAAFIYRNIPFAIHVAFMGMELEGLARKNTERLWVSPKDYSPCLREAVLYLSQRDMNVSIFNEQLCLLPKDIWDFTCKSISEWKNVYLEECLECSEKNRCGGFFASPYGEHRTQIHPI